MSPQAHTASETMTKPHRALPYPAPPNSHFKERGQNTVQRGREPEHPLSGVVDKSTARHEVFAESERDQEILPHEMRVGLGYATRCENDDPNNPGIR
jgi:hypothetical protein